jgi:hypothetical protein
VLTIPCYCMSHWRRVHYRGQNKCLKYVELGRGLCTRFYVTVWIISVAFAIAVVRKVYAELSKDLRT